MFIRDICELGRCVSAKLGACHEVMHFQACNWMETEAIISHGATGRLRDGQVTRLVIVRDIKIRDSQKGIEVLKYHYYLDPLSIRFYDKC